MKNYAQAANPRSGNGPQLVVNCAGPMAADSALPSFQAQADQYLAEETKPFFAIPIWVWIAIAGGAAWYFWGRKHWKIDLSAL